MRYLIITQLFIKRFIKNPTFILLLIIMPIMVTMFNKVDSKDEKRVNVGIYYETDELSKVISKNLEAENGYLKFLIYNNKDEMVEDVENKKLECGYVFPRDFKERLDNYNIKKCITCIESPSTILSSLSDEVVFGNIIEEYGKNIAVNFAEENNIVRSNTSNVKEKVINDYNKYNTPEKTFSINYKYIGDDGQISSEDGEKAVTYIIHGIMSVLILISGLFGAIKWFDDEKKGLYASFNSKEKSVIGFISVLVPTAIMALSSIITIYLSNSYTNMLRETIGMTLYILLVSGFSYLIKVITKSPADICAALPAMILGTLIFCPIFIDVSKFIPFISYVNKVFPTYYYLNVISGGASALILISVIAIAIITIGVSINYLKEK